MAIDIGVSGGHHIFGLLVYGKMKLEEVDSGNPVIRISVNVGDKYVGIREKEYDLR